MEPTLLSGDRVLIRTFTPFKEGDVVTAVSPVDGKFIVKRVISKKEDKVFLQGDNSAVSFDSRHHGPVKDKDIIGVNKLRIWPPWRIGIVR